MKAIYFLLSTILCCLTSEGAFGAIIVRYDFSGQPGDQVSTAATFAEAGLLGTSISRGSGVLAEATGDSMNSRNWTTALTPDANDYYEFGFGVASGSRTSLDSISFAERRSGTGIRRFELRSSLDGFAAAIAGSVTSVPDNTSTRDQTILLGSAFTNLNSAVTFRLFGYEAESAAGTWRLSNHSIFNGLVVQGSVTAVPEPVSTLSIGGLAAFAILLRRKKPASSGVL